MGQTVRRRLTPVPLSNVKIADQFWAPRLRKNRTATIPHIYRQMEQMGHIDAWKLKRKQARPPGTHPAGITHIGLGTPIVG